MKKIGLILLLLSYLPMFFLCKDCDIRGIYDSIYATLTTLGIAVFLLGDYLKTKETLYVPAAILFGVISIIFLLNTLLDSFYETYKPVLLIIISILLCYVLYCSRSIWQR